MHRYVLVILLAMSVGGWLQLPGAVWADEAPAEAPAAQTATGRVFQDDNENGRYDSDEPLLADIRVSNGREIVQTDADGRYRLPVDDDTILFVIKPRGFRTPLNAEQLPQFYYIHKPAGSPRSQFPGVAPTGPLPESIDFPLYVQDEPEQFRAILFGDPQPRDQKEVDYISHDIIPQLIGTDASFGVTLGDIVFDDLSLFSSLNKAIALVGIPWYNVIGNHDINRDADHSHHANETFESVYGPSYYSFDYGVVHFIVVDDIEWVVDHGDHKHYRGGLNEEQLAFLERDLSLIPEDQLVVLMMHIPLVDVHNRQKLYRLIEQRPFCMSISAHTHYHEHRFITREDGWEGPEPHHHVINVTVCGSWWSGRPDEYGIPHTMMRDGAPNGYSIISFDGHDYEIDFRAARRPASHQMSIFAPNVVLASAAHETDVYVNVFNGSSRSTVEMRLGESGDWTSMEQVIVEDPLYVQTRNAERASPDPAARELPGPVRSTHLWRARLPREPEVGTHLIHVRTTDMHGKQHADQRILRVDAAPPEPPAKPESANPQG